MENQELIVVKQLPEIEEHLKNVSLEIDKKVNEARSLVCTEENKQAVKNIRAELKKELEQFEIQRKAVKEKVLAPYMQFEEVYKECISDKFREADKDLKEKIDAIEIEQKKRLEDGAREYFEEYMASKNIDFIKFERLGLKVGLSDNPTKLKKQITAFINKIVDDLNLIKTQEHKAEILVEYKQTLNVAQAITIVINRFKAIEEEKKRQEELKKRRLEEAQKIADESIKVQTEATRQALENFIPKSEEKVEETILQAPVVEEKQEEILTLKFAVKGTRAKLKELKQFLESGGYEYE